MFGTAAIDGRPDTTMFTLPTDAFPNGPHLITFETNFRAVELRSAPDADPNGSCSVSYTVKWL